MVNWRWIGYNVDTGRQLGILCPFQKASFFFFGIAIVDFLLQIIQLSLIWENFYPENTSER